MPDYNKDDMWFFKTGKFNKGISQSIKSIYGVQVFHPNGQKVLHCAICRAKTQVYDELTKRPVCSLDCLDQVRKYLTKGRPPKKRKKK